MTTNYSKRTLKDVLGNPKPTSPVWTGPESDTLTGGITFSLLSRYLICKERFRLHTIEGLRSKSQFNHKLEYGNMWHICEEAFAKIPYLAPPNHSSAVASWENALTEYCTNLCKVYRHQQDEIDKWYNVCKTQFPIYIDFWKNNESVKGRTNLLAEQVFHVPYTIPSRRVVWLRGKWDSVDLIGERCSVCGGIGSWEVSTNKRISCTTCDGKGTKNGIYLQENKTKGDINIRSIERQMRYDLQTMLYLIALTEADSRAGVWEENGKWTPRAPILGVRYNVVRRPLSGGKGSITPHKEKNLKRVGRVAAETKSHFFARLGTIIETDPRHFFLRLTVDISKEDIIGFKRECLDPILENLADDYEWWDWVFEYGKNTGANAWDSSYRHSVFSHHFPRHYRCPFGVWNPLDDNGSSDLDNYLETGSMVGLEYNTNLFPELQGGADVQVSEYGHSENEDRSRRDTPK